MTKMAETGVVGTSNGILRDLRNSTEFDSGTVHYRFGSRGDVDICILFSKT